MTMKTPAGDPLVGLGVRYRSGRKVRTEIPA
jgi:hypothetical protein